MISSTSLRRSTMLDSGSEARAARVGGEDELRQGALTGKRILVTGASGFLGQHLLRRLSASGAEVHAVSRSHRAAGSAARRWWQCDCVDPEAVGQLLEAVRPDVTYHLAGAATGSPDLGLVLPILHSLLTSTVNLLTEAAQNRRRGRIILLRSLEEPDELSQSIPSSPYAAAKHAVTAYGRMFHASYGLPVVFVRPYMTFGPGQSPQKLIPYTILSLLRGVPPRVASGSRKVDWIYVDDVVDGLVRAAYVPALEGATVDLGSGILVSVREVVERLVSRVDPRIVPIFAPVPERAREVERAAAPAQGYEALGWRPTTSLDQGLDLTISWLRSVAGVATG